MAEIRLAGVTKSFGARVAVADATLEVEDGGFVVLLGPTGAGKTTLLRLVAGLERPDAGSVSLGGHDVTTASPAERDVAFVFQQYSLYPHLSVFDNLAFPLRSPARRRPEPEIARRVEEIARLLRLGDRLQSRVTQLSGGQMQRVAIGRALIRRPAAYLMDEPLSSLDAKLRADLRLELKRIHRELGATILYVTHDQIEAMTLASRIGVLREGRLVQVGTPREIYEEPVDLYVATRLGSPAINVLSRARFPALAAPPGVASLGIRTEHVRLAKANGGVHPRGTVRWIEHLGDQNHMHVAFEGDDLVTLCDPDAGIGVGDAVEIALERPLFFDAEGRRVRA